MEHFRPDVFIYENVPGLFTATADGNRIFEKLLNDFSSLKPAYEIIPPLHQVSKNPHSYILNSVNFGIPQSRKRLISSGIENTSTKKQTDEDYLSQICKKSDKIRIILLSL